MADTSTRSKVLLPGEPIEVHTGQADGTVECAKGEGAEIELSVVMPCLNEAETLEICINKALDCFKRSGIIGEVIIADNGSTDGSQDIARRCGARVADVPTRGYGAAIMGGIKAARGTYIIMGDADDSYDFCTLMPYVEKLRQGYELVVGNRFAGGIEPGAMPVLHRYLGTPVISWLGRRFFAAPFNDYNCGLRGFSRAAADRMDLRTTGMEFASEMVIKASLLDMKTIEVPTTLSVDGRTRGPHLRTWRDGWRHLRFMLLYSPRWLFFYPGLVLTALGLILSLWLLGSPRAVFGVTLDVHTLVVGAAAITIGVQAMMFAAFTETFARAEGLAPRTYRLGALAQRVPLEAGVVLGLFMGLSGVGLVLAAALGWRAGGFGDLDYQRTLRWVIPGVTLMVLGCQALLGSFFLGILSVRRR